MDVIGLGAVLYTDMFIKEVVIWELGRTRDTAVKAANKISKKIAQKMAFIYKDWHEMLPFALHEYCTSVHISTWATPSFINIHHEGHASRGGRSLVNRSSAEIQA
ncbi:hypothetical protein MTR_4g012705 [Medicago truncatula]|uniref:Uncharacterized protein n=1 Tax=Medicago truncatula TaxID=3880 RepID=A0A072USE0_MEDTR|nr:hypothetical protein MTR_4g012705 [Medicago truncatula]